jgi:hypothetical protein
MPLASGCAGPFRPAGLQFRVRLSRRLRFGIETTNWGGSQDAKKLPCQFTSTEM